MYESLHTPHTEGYRKFKSMQTDHRFAIAADRPKTLGGPMTMAADSKRVDALHALIECRAPLAEGIARVLDFPWDCDRELATLKVADVVSVLDRFIQGGLTSQDVEAWADALEVRDDVGCDSNVGELLFQLSNPDINGALTAEVVEGLIKRYDGRPKTLDGRAGQRGDNDRPNRTTDRDSN